MALKVDVCNSRNRRLLYLCEKKIKTSEKQHNRSFHSCIEYFHHTFLIENMNIIHVFHMRRIFVCEPIIMKIIIGPGGNWETHSAPTSAPRQYKWHRSSFIIFAPHKKNHVDCSGKIVAMIQWRIEIESERLGRAIARRWIDGGIWNGWSLSATALYRSNSNGDSDSMPL